MRYPIEFLLVKGAFSFVLWEVLGQIVIQFVFRH